MEGGGSEMNPDTVCAKLDGLDIGPREEAPAYSQSYDLIIPLVRKLTSADLNLRSKFFARIREEVAYKCPKNSVGNPVVSDWDAFVQATPAEWANAIIKASGINHA